MAWVAATAALASASVFGACPETLRTPGLERIHAVDWGKPGGAFRALREPRLRTQGRVLADRFHHVLKRTPMDERRALA